MTAVLEPRERHARPPMGAQRRSAIDRVVVTPLFTRHMVGALEADRDRRRAFRETHPRTRRSADAMAHPRIAAAIAARSRLAHVDESAGRTKAVGAPRPGATTTAAQGAHDGRARAGRA